MEHAWRDAVVATALISSVPTLILPFIPTSIVKPGSGAQRILLCFAVGGMLGDVFLHLLPHLLAHHSGGPHDHSHHHDEGAHDHHDHDHGHTHHHAEGEGSLVKAGLHAHSQTLSGLHSAGHGEEKGHAHSMGDLLLPLLVLGGYMFFFVSERVVRAVAGEGAVHAHSHSHGHAVGTDDVSRRKKDDDHVPEAEASDRRGAFKISGILNLAADALHNFSDGIAIGASFASGSGLGYSTALATLLHELPHEIGDFAVLVQSGMGKWQAIGAQFATASAAFAGTAIGLVATAHAGLEQPLLAITAGGFVYVSCVAVMPDILSGESPSSLHVIAEVCAMCAGIALMMGVAFLE